MKKSVRLVIFAFVFLMVLLVGCTSASTPIPTQSVGRNCLYGHLLGTYTARDNWELFSWISSSVVSVLTFFGLVIVIVQLHLQRKQARLEALDRLFEEFDTDEARLAREFIYTTPPEQLRMGYLHKKRNKKARKIVEDTLAMLERVAYKISTKQVPFDDAFDLYGGVLLSVASKLWGYIEDQRQMRKNTSIAHKLTYRRYFESVVCAWIPKYCSKINKEQPPKSLTTKAMLDYIFH